MGMNKKYLIFALFVLLAVAEPALAHLPRIVESGNVAIKSPEVSQAFYGELMGGPAEYTIFSEKSFNLYLGLLVPVLANKDARYSANIFRIENGQEEFIGLLDGATASWEEMWEKFGRDYYLSGPEFERQVEPGSYKIVVSGNENQGKYVLVVGRLEKFTILETIKAIYSIFWLKLNFFNSPIVEFFKTPFVLIGGMALVVLAILIGTVVYFIRRAIKSSKPKSIID